MDAVTQSLLSVLPEMPELLSVRCSILNAIRQEGPVGRRSLVGREGLSEREVRAICDLLRKQGLITAETSGMKVTPEGETVLGTLQPVIRRWTGLEELGTELCRKLGIQKVMVVPGGDDDELTKRRMARAACGHLANVLRDGSVVAVTGGSTIAAVADEAGVAGLPAGIRFIAARGGTGGDVKSQANMIAAMLAAATGGEWTPLHLPETLAESSIAPLMEEPSVMEAVALYDRTDCIVHGIGDALELARRRGSDEKTLEKLAREGAAAEAFGYYLGRDGSVIHRLRTIGLNRDQADRIPHPLAVAGGKEKAAPILAYMKQAPEQTVLVTDETAAREMLRLYGGETT
ncbi:Central glycolytic genes regulator protein [Bhargavaea cecembensis DSE10]|uniref:Central glycolytic genes regulator protein n=1 Tax=Bhargavaea cecembensis DSE10 TaxID=1235279 RepID=M7NVC9_9BACL|nr:sugar-binding domain-containing protein [Bhargavaea cecembensis]EMR05620.1 Central glycolytic genes regulator protein [Bhargavaea cecembensis DSE10]